VTSAAEADSQTNSAAQKKRKKRPNRKKPNDKLEAMNSFLLKMHGDAGPSSSAATNINSSSSNTANTSSTGTGANSSNHKGNQSSRG